MALSAKITGAVIVGLLAVNTAHAQPAANEPTTIRVALLDASAVESSAGGPAAGMMAPGTGFSGMGLMAPGMMARSGFGPGMMGMMSVRIDQNTVKAGPVTFEVTNWSRGIIHEMLVVPVDNASAALPYDFGKQEVVENQIKILGQTEELQPNASETVELTLPAGIYLLICNIGGHYSAGMATPLAVTP